MIMILKLVFDYLSVKEIRIQRISYLFLDLGRKITKFSFVVGIGLKIFVFVDNYFAF